MRQHHLVLQKNKMSALEKPPARSREAFQYRTLRHAKAVSRISLRILDGETMGLHLEMRRSAQLLIRAKHIRRFE